MKHKTKHLKTLAFIFDLFYFLNNTIYYVHFNTAISTDTFLNLKFASKLDPRCKQDEFFWQIVLQGALKMLNSVYQAECLVKFQRRQKLILKLNIEHLGYKELKLFFAAIVL